jgi:hypothetical protein
LDLDQKFHERRTIVIDLPALEAESEALRQRSEDLAGLLDAGHPSVTPPGDVLAESRRLGAAAAAARKGVAARLAAGMDAGTGVTVGAVPPIRRVRTDSRGRDLDPLHGRTVITAELVRFWEHRRDQVAAATEGSYREAAERVPYSPALVAAARGHISLLRERMTMQTEGGVQLESALKRYDDVYANLRAGAIDAQQIANQAQARLDSLEREKANAVVGADEVKGFIAAALSTITDLPTDPDLGLPLVPVGATPPAEVRGVARGGSPYGAKK